LSQCKDKRKGADCGLTAEDCEPAAIANCGLIEDCELIAD